MADTIPVIWGQTSDGKDAYVKTCTAGVYNPATGKTIDKELVTMQDSPAAITGETPIKPICDPAGNVICPQTRTEAVYDAESEQTLDKVLSTMRKTQLLATSHAVTSTDSSAVQYDLSDDLSKYLMLYFSVGAENGTAIYGSALLPTEIFQGITNYFSFPANESPYGGQITYVSNADIKIKVVNTGGAIVNIKVYGLIKGA